MRKTRTGKLKSLREQNFEDIVFAVLENITARIEFAYIYNGIFKIMKFGIIVINPLVYDVFDYFVKYMMRYIAFCPQKMHIDAAWAG